MASPSTPSIHKRPNNDASSSTPPVPKRFKFDASPSTPSIHKRFKYDVFLSFRGIDTRKNFVDHLYDALQRKCIQTYKDDERITKGKQICDELIGSIEDSKFYIIVFSKNYASSSWCLDELVKIMECHKTNDHTAYPVFYDVEPTEVRNQSGAVKEAFAKHENEAAAGKWRMALKEAADLAGWELKNTADGHEAKFIKKVVEEISLALRGINFTIDEKLVGMETRIIDVLSSLGTDYDDARMIGIKGMGGAGKTTLARAIFDQISFQFEGKSFVENVREVSKASLLGLKSLQNQILSDVFKDKSMTVSSVHEGIGMMKKMMPCKKVILVLDDVDHRDQLKALAGDMTWFMPGSIIIITTRDQQVLEFYESKLIHNVQLLSDEDAMCLFRRYAFGKVIPNPVFEELSEQFVKYAAGLPLAIEVLGSFLCGKDELEWKDALSRLKTIPSHEIMDILEISYRGLEEEYKEIFLNVACFLKRWLKSEAIKALESCGFYARSGLRVLELKSLITVERDGRLGMHDHIAEMGMNIVRRSHPNNPNKHSRLWIHEEIREILANDLGTEATRYIQFDIWELSPEIVMQGLRKMKELRFLHLSGIFYHASESQNWKFNELPNALQYLSWNFYPFRSLPTAFQADNLVALEMPDSRIVQLWEGGERKVLNKLRFLNLNYSRLRTFDLGVAPNLETLDLGECVDLIELLLPDRCLNLRFLKLNDSKLSYLDLRLAPNLEMLDLECCMNLLELRLPERCLNLRSLKVEGSKLSCLDLPLAPDLETLDLGRCMDLIELRLPERCLNIRSLIVDGSKLSCLDLRLAPDLETLDLGECVKLIELRLPERCLNLRSLKLRESKLRTLDIGLSPNLEYLDLRDCRDLEEFHMADGCLKKLVYLNLSGTLRFESFEFQIQNGASCSADESLEGGPLAELELIAESVDECRFHPDSNLPKFQFECDYKEDRPLLTRNLEKLISVGLCACTNLDTFSRSICGLQHLTKLRIKGSILEALKDLDQLECLEHLDFSGTKIRHLPDNICVLKHLKSIRLSKCTLLEKLPEDLGQLECLQELDFSYTNIEVLPGSICKLKHLKFLRLDGCSLLQKLPEDLGQLECLNLKELDLSKTAVKELPDGICMLKHLESLSLDGCSLLQKLPEDLGQLQCLRKLTLSDRAVKDIPDSICMLKHLESLDLSYCSLLEKLPEDLGRLECLRYLNLAGCIRVEKLPEEIGRLQCLKYLDLQNTGISHLPDSICMLKHLESLDLSYCSLLEKLPEDLGRLECLEDLDLRGCELLREVPDSICMLKHLKFLNINGCSLLEKLPEDLGRLECLRYLNLAGCIRVEKLPEEIGRLQCLKDLVLKDSGISHLPQSIFLLKGLCIYGSRGLLQSFGFTSEIRCFSEDLYLVEV